MSNLRPLEALTPDLWKVKEENKEKGGDRKEEGSGI